MPNARAKTIKMLLYDGSLNGVTNISDSAWELGKMYSAPRESIDGLISRADCKKYGVYLLLSENQVYIGQAVDLERRTKQHLSDKTWWDQVVLMTTKDDSFTASDIDYLESRLIDLATKAGTLDSDNRKAGNRQKVDEFRQAELEQYLEEAFFLLELIDVRVFKKKPAKPARSTKRSLTLEAPKTNNRKTELVDNNAPKLPELPSSNLKIGEFVYTTMKNLENCHYTFSENQIDEMCTPEWSQKQFHTKNPFMKRFVPGYTDNKGTDGYVRFVSTPYTFGTIQVLISKEWYERQRKYFIAWYSSLSL